MVTIQKGKKIWLVLLLLVISTNVMIYQTDFLQFFDASVYKGVVIGSLIDLLIVVPVLLCLYFKKLDWKQIIMFFAGASILAMFTIPADLLAPYRLIVNAGIAVEVSIIAFEILLIVIFIKSIPQLMKKVRQEDRPLPFAFIAAAEKKSNNMIVKIFAHECLVFYYAFASWKQKPAKGISLHHQSSFVAFNVMLLHAIVLESVGLHWYFHQISPGLSIFLLLLNVYTFIYFLAHIQAMRLNGIQFDEKGMYISFGLMKRAYIKFANIDDVLLDEQSLQLKKRKSCTEFICNDFEEVHPQLILKLKQDQQVELMYGMKKSYQYVAIKCDEPAILIERCKEELEKRNQCE